MQRSGLAAWRPDGQKPGLGTTGAGFAIGARVMCVPVPPSHKRGKERAKKITYLTMYFVPT